VTSRARLDDYVTGFRDGYECAVQEVLDLLGGSTVNDQLEEVKRRASLFHRTAKLLGLVWR
jgi:hypothetical protein